MSQLSFCLTQCRAFATFPENHTGLILSSQMAAELQLVAQPVGEGKKLLLQERRQERDGSLRMVYEARIADCRACEKRLQCQWHGHQAQHPRRVSVPLHSRKAGSAPLLWRDWPRRDQRRACIQVVRHQQLYVEEVVVPQFLSPAPPAVLTLSQRAHYRLSWQERLARNARADTADQLTFKLFGIPERFASWLGLPTR